MLSNIVACGLFYVSVQRAVVLGVEDPVPVRVLVAVVPLAVPVAVLLARVGLVHAVVLGAGLGVAVQAQVRPAVSVIILATVGARPRPARHTHALPTGVLGRLPGQGASRRKLSENKFL